MIDVQSCISFLSVYNQDISDDFEVVDDDEEDEEGDEDEDLDDEDDSQEQMGIKTMILISIPLIFLTNA